MCDRDVDLKIQRYFVAVARRLELVCERVSLEVAEVTMKTISLQYLDLSHFHPISLHI